MLNKNSIFVLVILGIGILLFAFLSVKALLLYIGILSCLLFFNVTLSTMTNVLTGAMVQPNDTIVRLALLLMASIFITLGIIV
jgi:hypothetical protein